MTRDQMQQFARFGARARLQAISQERDVILRAFPDLGRVAARDGASGDAVEPSARRRRMSPVQRKAVGERMRAYWAKRRAEKTGAKKARLKSARKSGMSAEARKAQGERMKAYWAAKRAEKQAAADDGAQARAGSVTNGGSSSRKSGRKAGSKQGRKK